MHTTKAKRRKQRREQLRKASQKYNSSLKGKVRRQKYEKTLKAKQRKNNYEKTDEAKMRKIFYKHSVKGRETIRRNAEARKKRQNEAKQEQKRKKEDAWRKKQAAKELWQDKFWHRADMEGRWNHLPGYTGKDIHENRLKYIQRFGTDDYYDDTNSHLKPFEAEYLEQKETGELKELTKSVGNIHLN